MKTALITTTLALERVDRHADPLNCNLTQCRAAHGLAAAVADDTLTLTCDGDRDQGVRLRLAINAGTPRVRDLAVRRTGGQRPIENRQRLVVVEALECLSVHQACRIQAVGYDAGVGLQQ